MSGHAEARRSCPSLEIKIFSKPLFNNFQDLPKSTEIVVQTHDWRGFFANDPTGNG
jgi:hypothetical protein